MLKVKAWDKELKQMFEVEELNFSQWWVQCKRPTDAPKGNGGAFYGERNSFNNEETDTHILLYPTGVKDINKKESYLGDILKDEGNKEEFGIVKKERDNNNMYVEWNNKTIYKGQKCWIPNKIGLNIIKQLEIVGNIYNNADMIKKEV